MNSPSATNQSDSDTYKHKDYVQCIQEGINEGGSIGLTDGNFGYSLHITLLLKKEDRAEFVIMQNKDYVNHRGKRENSAGPLKLLSPFLYESETCSSDYKIKKNTFKNFYSKLYQSEQANNS